MDRRRSNRRDFLGALIGGVALLGAGRFTGALADKNLGHGNKASFQSSCKQHGGEFVDSPKDKLTVCVWSDGSRTVCDGNGNDCTNFPPPKPKPLVTGGYADPFTVDGTLIEITAAPDPRPANGSSTRRGRHGKRRKT